MYSHPKNELFKWSGAGADESTVYGWNTKVSAPFVDYKFSMMPDLESLGISLFNISP